MNGLELYNIQFSGNNIRRSISDACMKVSCFDNSVAKDIEIITCIYYKKIFLKKFQRCNERRKKRKKIKKPYKIEQKWLFHERSLLVTITRWRFRGERGQGRAFRRGGETWNWKKKRSRGAYIYFAPSSTRNSLVITRVLFVSRRRTRWMNIAPR